MTNHSLKVYLIENKAIKIFIDIFVLIFCSIGIYFAGLKADIPFSFEERNSSIIITSATSAQYNDLIGKVLVSIDDHKFSDWQEAELYLEGKKIDDRVSVSILDGQNKSTKKIRLIPFYSTFDIIIIGFTGFIFLLMAVIVSRKSKQKKSADYFFLMSHGLGMMIMMTAGRYESGSFGITQISRIIWLFAFALTPGVFNCFAFSFTNSMTRKIKLYLKSLYILGFILAVYLSYSFLMVSVWEEPKSIFIHHYFYNNIFRAFVIICFLAGLFKIIFSYRKSNVINERKKLQWLLLGLIIGPLNFVLFWFLPMIILGYHIIPEFLALILLTAFPVTFGIAVTKYHLLNINLIIRRSVVYTIILTVIVIIYIIISALVTDLILNFNPILPSVLIAFTVAVMLQPVKKNIQKFVDKKFFRVEYDYAAAQKSFLEDIKNFNYSEGFYEYLQKRIEDFIPVEKIGVILFDGDNLEKIHLIKKLELTDKEIQELLKFIRRNKRHLPASIGDCLEPGAPIYNLRDKLCEQHGLMLIFPITIQTEKLHAALILGAKKSGRKYYMDDIKLLKSISVSASVTVERIKLQEELIAEKLEAKRLKELNQMKSFFVSIVSHELKTPLSSIRMFSEILRDKEDISHEKYNEYLMIIEGESDRLKRLIDNVLDITKIEKGIKTYKKSLIELNAVVNKSIDSMKYQFQISKIDLHVNIGEKKYSIFADEDAVEEALINLLSNAIKYSEKNKIVSVSLSEDEYFVNIIVKDEGIGIPEGKIDDIFQPFYRSDKIDSDKAGGTGLGLAIVKHIMDSHKGIISVESEEGYGSAFTLKFPLKKNKKDGQK